MKRVIYFIIGSFIFFVIGCGHSAEEVTKKDSTKAEESAKPAAENQTYTEDHTQIADADKAQKPTVPISSSAAVVDKKDSTRKFVRTAEIKFRAKDVIKTTYKIEDIVVKHGGFVTYTHLGSDIIKSYTTPVSLDSLLETTEFSIKNSMIIRVPNVKLDTVLKEIALLIDFLDYRLIKADDVALQILANAMAQRRAAISEQRITKQIDKKGQRLYENVGAEEFLSQKMEQADNAKLSNLALADKINFSTIQLEIYQRSTFIQELIANPKRVSRYEPSFGIKFINSLKTGWKIVAYIVLFLAKIWWLFALGIIIYVVIKIYQRKNKDNTPIID